MKDVFFEVDKDGWTGGIQLCIADDNGGYRLAGPKYNGSSKSLLRRKINERDAAEIRRYLDVAFPQEIKQQRDELLKALKDAADRLETCARHNGNSPEAIAGMMSKFKRVIAKVEGSES